MADYIKRTDAFDAVRLSRCDGCGRSICNYCPVASISVKLDNIPKADVRENVRGEWILEDESDVYELWKCSKCGNGAFDARYDFCPNCGADMRGENDAGRSD